MVRISRDIIRHMAYDISALLFYGTHSAEELFLCNIIVVHRVNKLIQ